MKWRAIPGIVLVVLGLGAIVFTGRETVPVADPFFAAPTGSWMPSVSDNEALTGSWFCPGVPATGEDGVGGEIVIANRDDAPLDGRFSILTPEGLENEESITVAPHSNATIDVGESVTAPFASVVVELDGGRGFVEQVARHPAGDSIAPCSADTSAEWYFADGFTRDGSAETLILTNPYDDAAVVNLRFATASGEAVPAAFQGFTIPPQTVKTIEMGASGLAARDEAVIGVGVVAQSGRLVVGRSQHFLGGGRLGYQVTLAAPALRDQFWFADGEVGEGITESYAVYNPTDSAVEVDVVFLGLPLDSMIGELPSIEVPAHRVVVFDPSEISEADGGPLLAGRHSTVFSTLADPSIVVERAITRPAGNSVATTVVMGAPPRLDGYVATRWHIGVGPAEPTEDALVVYNVDNVEGTISIEAIGDDGPQVVPSLADVSIDPGAVITIDLTDPEAIGRELIIDSTNRVFVERSFARGASLDGRTGSWALPASDW